MAQFLIFTSDSVTQLKLTIRVEAPSLADACALLASHGVRGRRAVAGVLPWAPPAVDLASLGAWRAARAAELNPKRQARYWCCWIPLVGALPLVALALLFGFKILLALFAFGGVEGHPAYTQRVAANLTDELCLATAIAGVTGGLAALLVWWYRVWSRRPIVLHPPPWPQAAAAPAHSTGEPRTGTAPAEPIASSPPRRPANYPLRWIPLIAVAFCGALCAWCLVDGISSGGALFAVDSLFRADRRFFRISEGYVLGYLFRDILGFLVTGGLAVVAYRWYRAWGRQPIPAPPPPAVPAQQH